MSFITFAFIGACFLYAVGGTTNKLGVSRRRASAVAWRSARFDR